MQIIIRRKNSGCYFYNLFLYLVSKYSMYVVNQLCQMVRKYATNVGRLRWKDHLSLQVGDLTLSKW